MAEELLKLRAELARVEPPAPTEDPLITLDQAAAMVRRSKRSLERYRGRMPAPRVPGGAGRASLWAWSALRPWLEATFGVQLPARFPAAGS